MDLSIITPDPEKLRELYVDISLGLQNMPIVQGTVLNQIAWVRTGAEVQGGQTKYPFTWFSDKGEKLNPYEELQAVPPEVVYLQSNMDSWGQKARIIPYEAELADRLGILTSFLPGMLENAADLQEQHLADLLGDGENKDDVYDGLKWLATAKRLNPNKAALGDFQNLYAGLNLDKAGLVQIIDSLDAARGPDGLVKTRPGQIFIICSNEDQYIRASDLLMGESLATAVGAAAASQSNKGLIGRAIPVKMSKLRDYNSNKGWYGVKIVSAQHRPVIASVRQPPMPILEGLDPNDFVRSLRNVKKYSWRGQWSVDPGFPHLIRKAIEK